MILTTLWGCIGLGTWRVLHLDPDKRDVRSLKRCKLAFPTTPCRRTKALYLQADDLAATQTRNSLRLQLLTYY